MTESRQRDWWIDKLIIPVMAAIIGAIAASWFQASALDHAQLKGVVALIKDPAMSADQKIKALDIYREITDRPWSLIRTLVTSVTVFLPMFLMALLYRGRFDRNG